MGDNLAWGIAASLAEAERVAARGYQPPPPSQ